MLILWAEIYGPAQILWHSIYIILSLSEVNNFVVRGSEGELNITALYGFIGRIIVLTFLFGLIIEYASSIGTEAEKTLILVNKIWSFAKENDFKILYQIQKLSYNQIKMTCWQFFYLKRVILLRALSILIYYLFVSLQMHALR